MARTKLPAKAPNANTQKRARAPSSEPETPAKKPKNREKKQDPGRILDKYTFGDRLEDSEVEEPSKVEKLKLQLQKAERAEVKKAQEKQEAKVEALRAQARAAQKLADDAMASQALAGGQVMKPAKKVVAVPVSKKSKKPVEPEESSEGECDEEDVAQGISPVKRQGGRRVSGSRAPIPAWVSQVQTYEAGLCHRCSNELALFPDLRCIRFDGCSPKCLDCEKKVKPCRPVSCPKVCKA